MDARPLEAPIYYLRRDEIHSDIKPFKLTYDPGKEIPRSNCTYEKVYTLISDLRHETKPYNFTENGFNLLPLASALSPDQFDDRHLVESIYYEELRQLLIRFFRATRVEILEHIV